MDPRSPVTAIPRVPAPANEPTIDWAPQAPETALLHTELERVAGQVRELQHVIAGERIGTSQTTPVVMPHRHAHVLANLATAEPKHVQLAIEAALAARDAWSRMAWWDRAAVFTRAAELVTGRYRLELTATTMLGQSKTYHQAEIDVCELADFFRYNAHFARSIYDTQPDSVTGEWNYVDHKPLEGFVLAITPFNFTAISGNLPATPALMGNVVVWKPAEKAALSADVVMRVFEEAGLPAGVINLVHGSGSVISEEAMRSEHFAGLTFTGSTAVFNTLYRDAAQNLDHYRGYPRLVGETGGKNAVVVHPSADADAVFTALVRSSFEYQGQKCSAASRAYVPRSLWAGLRERLVQTVGTLPLGDVTSHDTFLGAVIDEKAFRRLSAAIDRAKALDSHTLVVGGGTDDSVGWFVEPTIFETTDPHAFTMQEEFFGPLLTVHVYDDSAEDAWTGVLHLSDSTSRYALTASIWAADRSAIVQALDVLRDAAGMTYVNDKPTGALIGRQAFGGGRASGTNDKTGSALALQRWVNARFVKENLNPAVGWTYPYMNGHADPSPLAR
ncbi:L-glutamate gamma-semialdehyde dehydrogenase [Kineococcus arenarius]|uniref:L-glutamate gamma-semialdehyde dehydrogenase n=1 Tax=unclassified Kineococcus TaxID=2621656 RepID=UPI003D7CB86E